MVTRAEPPLVFQKHKVSLSALPGCVGSKREPPGAESGAGVRRPRYACLERMRELVGRAADAADGEVAQAALDAWAAKRLATFEDAERGLLFGRLDFEAVERALYVGRRWVHDDEGDQIVVNWQAPAARPFYTATPQDPQRVTLRRRFRAQGRKLLDIADETLDGSTLDGASVGDFLLEELERSREGHMRDIVATIQADQYRLITHAPDRPLVIQGGPGTGKTAVGLHRASWLIYTERERNARSRVLVVGPNRTFMEYVSHVLPALGEDSVEQLAVADLVDGRRARERRSARGRAPEGRHASGGGDRPRRRAQARRRARGADPEARGRVHPRPRPRAGAASERDPRAARHDRSGARALPDGDRPQLLLRVRPRPPGRRRPRRRGGREGAASRAGTWAAAVDRAWPAVVPEKLVRSLFTTRRLPGRRRGGHPRRGRAEAPAPARRGVERRRRAAAGRGARARRVARAHVRPRDRRRGAGSLADAAADDLPARPRTARSRSSATSRRGRAPSPTRAGTRCLPYLRHGDEAEVEELRHAYRVPREIMELALPLLDTIAPGIERPLAYRVGGSEPILLPRVRRTPSFARPTGRRRGWRARTGWSR